MLICENLELADQLNSWICAPAQVHSILVTESYTVAPAENFLTGTRQQTYEKGPLVLVFTSIFLSVLLAEENRPAADY